MAFNKSKALQEAEKLVSQGKTAAAIKQYLYILEKDPADLTLLNTVGDLYVRDKNATEALKYFNKLADTYTRQGFTLKAIAIYRKVSKLDPNSVEALLKLGELYVVQGLSREAREHYTQAVEFFRKKNQHDKAAEVFQRIIQLDPENPALRTRLAEFCEQAGRKAEASKAYLESAQMALRRGELPPTEQALKKALHLDPKNPQAHIFKARLALASQHPEHVENILAALPDLKNQPAARALLLEAYLGTHNLRAAEKILLEVYRAHPEDFEPLASFAALCIEKGQLDAALKPLAELADELIEKKNVAPLSEILRQMWNKNPNHVPTLELFCRVCDRTADEFTLPEVLEALGHAYVQAGEFGKAEEAYEKLSRREPENEQYKGLLKQVRQKQGKEVMVPSGAALSAAALELTPEAEAEAAGVPPVVDAEQAGTVKEALENSDLYSRYGLIDKAVAELEKVLATYPDQVDIHNRILEICQRNQPRRAAQAAEALSRIYSKRGDAATAHRYDAMAHAEPATPGVVEAVSKPEAPVEFDLAPDVPVAAQPEPRPAEPAPPEEVPLDLAGVPLTGAEPPLATPEAQEIDLSTDFAVFAPPAETAARSEAPPPAPPAAPFNYEDARTEIDFYLEQGFTDEGRAVIRALEEKHPGNAQVAELRRQVEERLAAKPREEVREPAPTASGPVVREVPLDVAAGPPPPGQRLTEPPAPTEAPPAEPPVTETVPPPPAPVMADVSPAGGDLLSSLAGDLASSLEGLDARAVPSAPSPPAKTPAPPSSQTAPTAASLSGLLEELGEPAEATASQEDSETHYNLGVAFREMGLLDEAIGEFQKVVKGAQKDKLPVHFLQACTLLASCFMDKGMPAIAAKWYIRALEIPNLDEDAMLAIYYDLGVAYEQAGDTRNALEKFTEVYSVNIDYRDVAEKIRRLQQKVS